MYNSTTNRISDKYKYYLCVCFSITFILSINFYHKNINANFRCRRRTSETRHRLENTKGTTNLYCWYYGFFFRVSFTCVSIMYVILHRFCIDLYLSVSIIFYLFYFCSRFIFNIIPLKYIVHRKLIQRRNKSKE